MNGSRTMLLWLLGLGCAGTRYATPAPPSDQDRACAEVAAKAKPLPADCTKPGAPPCVLSPPKVLHEERAQYPKSAHQHFDEGGVTMQVSVETNGEPSDVAIIQSGGAVFDATALKAMKAFTFSPACFSDGRVRRTSIYYRYTFVLSPRQSP